MENNIRVSFDIFNFDCTPEELTKKIGIVPTEKYTKGDIKYLGSNEKKIKFQIKENRWSLSCKDQYITSLEDQLKYLLSKLTPHKSELVRLTKGYKKVFNCSLEFKESRPGVHLDRETIEGINALDAVLDLDIYFLDRDN